MLMCWCVGIIQYYFLACRGIWGIDFLLSQISEKSQQMGETEGQVVFDIDFISHWCLKEGPSVAVGAKSQTQQITTKNQRFGLKMFFSKWCKVRAAKNVSKSTKTGDCKEDLRIFFSFYLFLIFSQAPFTAHHLLSPTNLSLYISM